MIKQPYFRYDSTYSVRGSRGALKIYLPCEVGYIGYVITHSVVPEITCDTWRLSAALSYNDELGEERSLTPSAEWDMALAIKGRDDFIGGLLHGDEIYSSMHLCVDGDRRDPVKCTELSPFNTLTVTTESVGLDPADHTSEVLRHHKRHVITADGVTVEQRVEWLGDYELSSCFMGMMPPRKELVDSYYTDVTPEVAQIVTSSFEVAGCCSATLLGKNSGYHFRMSVPKYPSYESGNRLLVRDNGRPDYNKMYFPVCLSESVTRGEVWKTVTEYKIWRSANR